MLPYATCCIGPDIIYIVNKLAKFANNPNLVCFRAILNLIGFIKSTSRKGIKFYTNTKVSSVRKVLKEGIIKINKEAI